MFYTYSKNLKSLMKFAINLNAYVHLCVIMKLAYLKIDMQRQASYINLTI